MKLYFIRHGKASYLAESDEMRPLYPEGHDQAQKLGAALKALGVQPTALFTSPRLRAQETAGHIGSALGIAPQIEEAVNFEFTREKAFDLVTGLDDEAEVLFVGHNPSMSMVVSAITGAVLELPTAGIACVTRIYPPSTSSAILKWMMTPKILNAVLNSADDSR